MRPLSPPPLQPDNITPHLLQCLVPSNKPFLCQIFQVRIGVQNHLPLPSLHRDTAEQCHSPNLRHEVPRVDVDRYCDANAPRRDARVVDLDVSFGWEGTIGFVDQGGRDPGYDSKGAAGVVSPGEGRGV